MCLEADDGCGKSVCTKSLVNEKVFDDGGGLVCAYFITKHRPDGGKAATVLQSLLYQIFTARPTLMATHATDNIKNAASSVLGDKELLWDMLFSAISDPAIGDEIVLLIDGVDECDDYAWLISKISKLWHRTVTQEDIKRPRLKLFYTEAQLSSTFGKLRVISGQDHADQIGLDLITLYKRYLKGCNYQSFNIVALSQAFEKFRQQNANYLAFDLFRLEIEKQTIDKSRQHQAKFLTTMPRNLTNVYQYLLKECDSDEIFRVLCIVVGAVEPLTVEQLSVAFAIRSDIALYDDIPQKRPRHFEQFLLKTCGPFFKVVNNKVYLIHHTLKDYLTASRKYGRPAKFREVKGEGHKVLSIACISFLNLKDIAPNRVSTVKSLPTSSSKKRKIAGSATSGGSSLFFKYAARYWVQHFRSLVRPVKECGILQELCTPQKVGEIPHLLQLCRSHTPEIAELATEIENLIPRTCLTEEIKTIFVLYIASWLGLDVLLKHMLPTRWGQKIPPAPGTNLAQTYINRAPRKGYLTPLGVAVSKQHTRSIELLLRGETVPLEVDMSPHLSLQLSINLDWTTLWHHAIRLEEKDEGNALARMKKQYEEQLKAAVTSGSFEYVEKLLSRDPGGGYIDLLQSVYSSALYAAVDTDEPNINIVERLLEYGAWANYRVVDEETILEAAAQHGEPELVILLLRSGAYPNVHSNRGRRWYEYAGMRDAAKEAGIDIAID